MSRPIRAAQNAGTQAETPPTTTDPHPGQDPGAATYARRCAVCHGAQREGNLPGFPPLIGINRRLSEKQMADLIHSGKGRMPGFPNLQGGELTALLKYLTTPQAPAEAAGNGAKGGEGSASRRLAERSSTRTAPSATAAMPWVARQARTLRSPNSFFLTPPARR